MNLYQDLLLPDFEFTNPLDVLAVDALTKEQKINLLRQWEYDEREKEIAQNEGMQTEIVSHIGDIHKALRLLGVDPDSEHYS